MMLAACSLTGPAGAAETGTIVLKTETGEHPYTIELAITGSQRAKGLMFRRTLPKTHGMLFLYDPPQEIGMWMRNTYIPLDMVFIDAEGRVHRIETHTEPFSTTILRSGGAVAAVLELNAGEAEKIGLRPGDEVVHPALGRAP
jgi:uncharacterized membrane protein (UPF0127 family)